MSSGLDLSRASRRRLPRAAGWARASARSIAGAALILLALVILLVAPLAADHFGDVRRKQISEDLQPLEIELDRVETDVFRLAADTRDYALTGDEQFRQRYNAGRLKLKDDLASLGDLAARGTFSDEAQQLIADTIDWAALADQTVAARAGGDDAEARRLLLDLTSTRLDALAAGGDGLKLAISGEIDRINHQIERVDRDKVIVLGAAGALGIAAAIVLIWLTASRQRLLDLADRERARFSSMIASLRYSVYQMDAQGRMVYLNPAAEELLGYRAEEILGRDVHAVIHHSRPDGSPLPREECPFARVIAEGTPRSGEDAFIRKDGSFVPVEVQSAPIVAGGRTTGAVVVFQDISGRLRQERMRDHFITFASHELRSPLTVMYGFCRRLANKALREPHLFDEESREAIHILNSETERMESIVRLFLDLARIQSDRLTMDLETVDLCELVHDEADALRLRYPTVSIEEVCPPGPVLATSDGNRLRQVLTNLLDNGAKYGGECLTISLTLDQDNTKAVIAVRDRGPGIPLKDQPHIFEPFYRGSAAVALRKKSLGVGLFITKEIVARLGGDLTFESVEGEGTEFRVTLPLAPAPVPVSRPETAAR